MITAIQQTAGSVPGLVWFQVAVLPLVIGAALAMTRKNGGRRSDRR